MDEVREKTRELAEALARSEEYRNFLRAKEGVEKSAAASKMLNDFIKLQTDLRKAQLRGEKVSEDQIKQVQRSFEIINFNPYIRDYFMADFKLMELMGEIQRTLSKAIGVDLEQFNPFAMDREESEEGTKESKGAEQGNPT